MMMSKHNAEAVAVQIEEQWGNVFVASAVRSIGEENAKLREELAAWKTSAIEREALCVKMEAELPKVIAQLEAAEAKIKAASEQELHAKLDTAIEALEERDFKEARQEKRIAELERKLAEQQAAINQYEAIISESEGVSGYHLNGDVALWDEFNLPTSEATELNTLLAAEYKRGRADERAEAEKEEPVAEVEFCKQFRIKPLLLQCGLQRVVVGAKLYTRPLAQKPLSEDAADAK